MDLKKLKNLMPLLSNTLTKTLNLVLASSLAMTPVTGFSQTAGPSAARQPIQALSFQDEVIERITADTLTLLAGERLDLSVEQEKGVQSTVLKVKEWSGRVHFLVEVQYAYLDGVWVPSTFKARYPMEQFGSSQVRETIRMSVLKEWEEFAAVVKQERASSRQADSSGSGAAKVKTMEEWLVEAGPAQDKLGQITGKVAKFVSDATDQYKLHLLEFNRKLRQSHQASVEEQWRKRENLVTATIVVASFSAVVLSAGMFLYDWAHLASSALLSGQKIYGPYSVDNLAESYRPHSWQTMTGGVLGIVAVLFNWGSRFVPVVRARSWTSFIHAGIEKMRSDREAKRQALKDREARERKIKQNHENPPTFNFDKVELKIYLGKSEDVRAAAALSPDATIHKSKPEGSPQDQIRKDFQHVKDVYSRFIIHASNHGFGSAVVPLLGTGFRSAQLNGGHLHSKVSFQALLEAIHEANRQRRRGDRVTVTLAIEDEVLLDQLTNQAWVAQKYGIQPAKHLLPRELTPPVPSSRPAYVPERPASCVSIFTPAR